VIIGGHEHTLPRVARRQCADLQDDFRRARARTDRSEHSAFGELDSIDWKVIHGRQTPQRKRRSSRQSTKNIPSLWLSSRNPVGSTTVALDARSAENRTRETNVGNFITDAFRKCTAADVGFMNGGSVRADGIIGPGKLTQRDSAVDLAIQK
jgi:hypothetical protein